MEPASRYTRGVHPSDNKRGASGGDDDNDSARWQCRVCKYIYDPALHGGRPFETLPEDWVCPGCGFGKAVFARKR